jgi:hypothetical protein
VIQQAVNARQSKIPMKKNLDIPKKSSGLSTSASSTATLFGHLKEQPTPKGSTVCIPTLDISVDMLKRHLLNDAYTISQFGLNNKKSKSFLDDFYTPPSKQPFQLVALDKLSQEWRLLDFTRSLKELGLRNGDTVFVMFSEQTC